MSFTRAVFTPTNGLRDSSTYITTPATEADARSQIQTGLDQMRDAINTFETELESVVDGSSGADKVGITPITGVAGSTIQAITEDLKAQIDTKSASSNVYTKTELDGGQLDTRYYTETETNTIFSTKSEVAGIVLGQIPDGTLTTAKMATEQKKGVANGVASLDSNSQVPTEQLGNVVVRSTYQVALNGWRF